MINDDIIEEKQTGLEDLFVKLKEYAETRINLLKLTGISKVSGIMSTVISMVILIILVFIAVICLTIGLAVWIGDLLGAAYYGFFIIAALYIIIGLVVYANRGKLLKNPISDKLIKEMVN